MVTVFFFFFFQAEDGIRDFCLSRGLGDVYKETADIGPHSTEPVRFGLFPVRSPLLGESRLISFPQGT